MRIFLHKTDAMQKILNLVSRGYIFFTEGFVPIKKSLALSLKFSDRYGIERTTQQRYRAKKKSEANAHLVMWKECDNSVRWWLVATAGDGLVHDLEKLQRADDKKNRLQLTGYELIKMPRTGSEPAWTWRMTKENFEAWQERLRSSVRRNNSELISQAMFSLKRTPGFAQSRRQAFTLFRFAKAEWSRTQKGDWPYENVFVGFYGRFKKAETVPTQKF